MPGTLKDILDICSSIAKENIIDEVVCPVCGERLMWIKYGFYPRYIFSSRKNILIQRYLCLNKKCQRRTFSILPYPMLPILRVSVFFLLAILSRHEENGENTSCLARESGMGWGVMRRMLQAAEKVRIWLRKEGYLHCFGSDPCRSRPIGWAGFIREFSWAIYPARFAISSPTQLIYS